MSPVTDSKKQEREDPLQSANIDNAMLQMNSFENSPDIHDREPVSSETADTANLTAAAAETKVMPAQPAPPASQSSLGV